MHSRVILNWIYLLYCVQSRKYWTREYIHTYRQTSDSYNEAALLKQLFLEFSLEIFVFVINILHKNLHIFAFLS